MEVQKWHRGVGGEPGRWVRRATVAGVGATVSVVVVVALSGCMSGERPVAVLNPAYSYKRDRPGVSDAEIWAMANRRSHAEGGTMAVLPLLPAAPGFGTGRAE